MSTTADLPEAGWKSLGIQSLRASRQSREARIKFRRVFVVSSFFVVMLGANLFIGAVVIGGRIRAHAAAEQAAANGQTAQIRRPLLDGTFCRNIVFDNNSAQTIEDKVERCDQLRNKPGRKSKVEFSWGRK